MQSAAKITASNRIDGYAPIRDYGVLGDGRTVALVAADGRVDWWPVPTIDAPAICAAIVDAKSGGFFALYPAVPCQVKRRYVPGTNVIETVYSAQRGRVRVTDSLNSGAAGRLPWTELARRVECLDGAPGNGLGTGARRPVRPRRTEGEDGGRHTRGDHW